MLSRIYQYDAVLVEQSFVALHHDVEFFRTVSAVVFVGPF
jgi:hypothetical protein